MRCDPDKLVIIYIAMLILVSCVISGLGRVSSQSLSRSDASSLPVLIEQGLSALIFSGVVDVDGEGVV